MDLWKESTVPESELNPLTILTHESDQQNPSEFDIDYDVILVIAKQKKLKTVRIIWWYHFWWGC